MKRFFALLFAAAIIGGVAESSYALTEYTFGHFGGVSGTYSPNQANQLAESLSVSHKVPGHTTATANYFITFSPGQSTSCATRWAVDGSGDQLSYQIVDNPTSNDILCDSSMPGGLTLANVLSGTSTSTETITQSFYVTLSAGQLPPAGTYTDSVTASVYGGTIASSTYESNATITLNFTVPAVLGLSLVSTGGSFVPANTTATMNFGTMSTGETGSMDLLVQSNSSYSVSLQSQNGGVMGITLAGDTSTVPYTLTFAGTPVTLPAATPTTVVSTASPTSGAGARYPINVTLGNIGTATAGTYQDNITITVTAL